MTYARTTTVDDSTDGDSVKQACLDLDTDLTLGFANVNTVAALLDDKIPVSKKGTASGVCDLDADGLIPLTRLPTLPASVLPAGKSVPVGTVAWWPSVTIPDGFFECDGRWLVKADYADLYTFLKSGGATCIYGENTTSFKIPDYRGLFIRGWDHGAGRDPDRASRKDRGDGTTGDYVGTLQDSEIQSHTHNFLTRGDKAPSGTGMTYYTPGSTEYDDRISKTGGKESRPCNVVFIAVIKA